MKLTMGFECSFHEDNVKMFSWFKMVFFWIKIGIPLTDPNNYGFLNYFFVIKVYYTAYDSSNVNLVTKNSKKLLWSENT